MVTTIDGKKLNNLFKSNNGVINAYYDDENNNKKLFFQYKANYDYNNTNTLKTGLSFKSYISWINENEDDYYTEYLVDNDFIVETFRNKANLELIDKCSFYDFFKNNKNFFNNNSKFESDNDTKKYLLKVNEFFTKNITNEQIFSFLNTMYIFKKLN